MKKLLMTLTISVVASIMIIGALIASPDAYSVKNNNELDECKCEKPHTLKLIFTAPDVGDYRVEIFKKLDDKNNEDKLLDDFPVTHNEIFMVVASNFGKDKLESNTAFVFYEVDGGTDPVTNLPVDVIVATMEIHTSCSKPLFIGQTVSNNGYSIEVKDGLAGMSPDIMTSIPIANASICEDEKKKSTGSITVKKALTNDNGGTAKFEDFTITVTNADDTPFDLLPTGDPSISTIDVPAGTYTLSETELDGYTTVLIAGDTGCPSMLDEVFTIKKNKNLSCTIYNDDDSDDLERFVFQNESLKINFNDHTEDDSCKLVDSPSPCIFLFDDEVSIAIVDPKLVSTTTIILFSVFATDPNEFLSNVEPQCDISQIIAHNDIPGVDPSDETLSVVLICSGFDTNKIYNVNYVMINPSM